MTTPSIVAIVRAAQREHGAMLLALVAEIVPWVARDALGDAVVSHPAYREWDTAVRCVRHARKIGISTDEVVRCLREDVKDHALPLKDVAAKIPPITGKRGTR